MILSEKPKATFLAEVHIREVATGIVRVYESEEYEWEHGWSDYMWRDGNYACDCNRELFFRRAAGEPEEEVWREDRSCSHGRFRVDKIVDKQTGRTIYAEAA